jgi:hypothetical protein
LRGLREDLKRDSGHVHELAVHRRGILAYYDYPISTGPLEGTNNKIRTLQRQAYRFRDREFFKLKIYGLHETKYALDRMNQELSDRTFVQNNFARTPDV